MLIESLAELSAIERLNVLEQLLPPDQLEYAVPLELNAGGMTNFQRLCLGFRARPEENLLRGISCSFDETVLAGLEASAEGSTNPKGEPSIMESAQTGQEPPSTQQEPPAARQNAQLAFNLLFLRTGSYEAAGYLLGADAGACEHAYCSKHDQMSILPLL